MFIFLFHSLFPLKKHSLTSDDPLRHMGKKREFTFNDDKLPNI